jgi:2-polyprenyl-6-methoxyphenol hydroxylase-like FAD-dependent oxidoreductase
MATITILGAGVAGLTTAMLLAGDGHDVTVLERDPAPPADDPWQDWHRPGVNQFRLPHYLLPRWWTDLQAVLPDAAAAMPAAGATRVNPLTELPPEMRGDTTDDDRRFDTVTARRPVLEAALAGAAQATGVTVGRGVRVTGVVLTAAAGDRALRPLRDTGIWSSVVRRYPHAAGWIDAEPLTGVDVMAGLEDRLRRYVVDGAPVATGLVAVGDAWACTNPSLGRGASFALIHARLLRDVLRETGADEHEKLARRFHEATARTMEPLYRVTNGFDRHRLAEIEGDAACVPYRPADPRWVAAKALFAAALRDPVALRAQLTIGSFLATPDEVFAAPGLRDRVLALGMSAPQYPLPGPSRAGLLRAVTGGVR